MRILLFAGLKMAPLFSKKSSLFQIMARRKKITFFYRADMELFSLGIFSSGKLGTIYRANSPLFPRIFLSGKLALIFTKG